MNQRQHSAVWVITRPCTDVWILVLGDGSYWVVVYGSVLFDTVQGSPDTGGRIYSLFVINSSVNFVCLIDTAVRRVPYARIDVQYAVRLYGGDLILS